MFLGLGTVLCFAILSAGGSFAALAQDAVEAPAAPAVEEAAAERPAAELPIRRVALFASGVGYFERSGMVAGGSDVQMMFRVEDINDILKSMVITGAENAMATYGSRDPASRALRAFEVDLTGEPTLAQLLGQLRGAEVEVRVPQIYRGRVVSVEQRTVQIGDCDKTTTVDVLVIIGDVGLMSFEIPEIQSIRLTDEALNRELQQALTVIGLARDKDKRPVTVHVSGEGEQRLWIGYVVQSPVWKTSYRLVLREEGDPFLQGWAIVENTSDNDWTDVELTLVSGQPISFVMDLYTPLYVSRPEVKPELYAQVRPQVYAEELMKSAAAMEELQTEGRVMRRLEADSSRAMNGSSRERGLGYSGMAPSAPAMQMGEISGMASMVTGASAVAELFQYPIAQLVTLPRQKSAMLPILGQNVKAERMSIYDAQAHEKFPMIGLELKNTSGLYLMQGPITVYDQNLYAGDARIGDLAPGGDRLISYAIDQKREVLRSSKGESEMVSLKIIRGVLVVSRRHERATEYTIVNKADDERLVLVQHPYDQQWELVEPEKRERPETATHYRFRVNVPGRQGEKNGSKVLKVVEQRMIDEHVAITNLNSDAIIWWTKQRQASRELVAALGRVVEMKERIATLTQELNRAQEQMKEIGEDQARTRENMRVLPQNNPLQAEYVQKWQQQEQQLEDLRARQKELRGQIDAAQRELNQFIQSLMVE